jgi:protein-S-isoprenylcysteine O-methyltransferase
MARRPDPWLLAGYAGVACFGLLERTLRPRETAARPSLVEDDGTTRTLGRTYAVAAAATPFLARLPLRPLPRSAQSLGLGLEVAGLGLRTWSMRTLDESYTRRLRVANAQVVIERGPYRHIRHPHYAGSLLIWLGFSLSSGSVAAVAAICALLVPTYRRRMLNEEELLAAELVGYEGYVGRTKRLVPVVW